MVERVLILAGFLLFAVPITAYDIRERRIPDLLVFGGLALCLALSAGWPSTLPAALLGAALGFAVFALLWLLVRGRLGFGDVKYSALIGAAAGVGGWCIAIFVASLCALLAALVLLAVDRRYRFAKIPFAPFLSAGGAVALCAPIFHWGNLIAGGLL